MERKINTCVCFTKEDLESLRKHSEETGESASLFLRRLLKEWRVANDSIKERPVETLSVTKENYDEIRDKIKAFLAQREYIVYAAKAHQRLSRKDLGKIKDELFFSEFQVDTTIEVIRPVLREAMAGFDVRSYEIKQGIGVKR